MDENVKQGPMPGVLGGTMPKPWAELTDSERIEVLRHQARDVRYLTRRVYQLEKAVRTLEEHDHINGKVVMTLRDRRDYDGDSPMTYDRLA